MKKTDISRESIVFVLFVVTLAGSAQVDNLLTLLQNVAILGTLELGMLVV